MPGEELALGVAGSVAGGLATEGAKSKLMPDERPDTVIDFLREQARQAEVQRTRTLWPYDIGSGNSFTTHARLRMEYLLVSGAPGDVLALQISGSTLFKFLNPTGNPVPLPMPLLFDSGKTIQVVNISDPSDLNFYAYLFAYLDGAVPQVRHAMGMDR